MLDRNFFQLGDAGLATGSANCNTLISATGGATTYGLLLSDVTAFSAANAAYQTAYAAAINPATRTKAAVAAKSAARTTLVRVARSVALKINGTPGVTDAQKITLGLVPRKTPSSIPAPTVKPTMEILSVNGNTVRVSVRQADKSKRGKLAGTYGVQVLSYVGTNPPNDPTLWRVEGNATALKFDVAFPADLPAYTRVYLTACWISPRLQAGPGCTPIAVNLGSFIVQANNTESEAVVKLAA